MPRQVEFRLPYPPSANNLFVTIVRKGKVLRVLGEDAAAYRKLVGRQIMINRVPRHVLTGKLAVRLYVHAPKANRRRDLGNIEKALLDAVKEAGVIVDDSDIDDLHITRGVPFDPPHVLVVIREIPGGATTTEPLPLPEPIAPACVGGPNPF